MQEMQQKSARLRTGKKTGIWLALVVALALHSLVLLMPIVRQIPSSAGQDELIELRFTNYKPQGKTLTVDDGEPEDPPPESVPEAKPPDSLVKTQTITEIPVPEPATPLAGPVSPLVSDRPANRDKAEIRQLSSTILARQFISEESVTEQIFGKPLLREQTEPKGDFYFPVRQDMISMLDQPLPEVPFAYTPNLVYFAYEPGVRGDFQRFFDVITPEFGWRTNNGTEFKCILILVIVGCGWK